MAGSANDGTNRGTRTLVLAPTRELVVQIEENVRAYAKHLPQIRVATVFGGVGERPQIRRCARVRTSSSRAPAVCSTSCSNGMEIFRDLSISCSTKPIACWTWALFPRSARS
jgi:hypothetical protein